MPTVKLMYAKKITSLTCLSKLEMKTAISWHYSTKLSLAPKRGYASCESIKCLSKGRQRAFHFFFKVGRMDEVLEAPNAGGPVRVGLCVMSREILDCLKRKRAIRIKIIIPS